MWETIANLVDGAADAVSDIFDTASTVASDVVDGVGDAADWVGTQASDAYDWVGNQLKDVTTKDVLSTGLKAVQGGAAAFAGTSTSGSGSSGSSSNRMPLNALLNPNNTKTPNAGKTAVAKTTDLPSSDPYESARRMAKTTEWM